MRCSLNRWSHFAALVTLSALLCACGAVSVAPVANACAVNAYGAACAYRRAEDVLATVGDAFDWTTSATELAIAADRLGKIERAWALQRAAVERLDAIDDAKRRDTAMADIALSLSALSVSPSALQVVRDLKALLPGVSAPGKRVDIRGKLLTARAVHGDADAAVAEARALAANSDTADAFKGRTLREIAHQFAKRGEFERAVETASAIDARFTYYAAVARTDIASVALRVGRDELVPELLAQADAIAQAQSNGYFAAGIYREIAHCLSATEDVERRHDYVQKAQIAARLAPSHQEQARALSRIATRLADSKTLTPTRAMIGEALALAQDEASVIMRNYAFYEIAGSAAFTKDFATARSLRVRIPIEPFGSASSLRAAAERDLAWGLVRYGQVADGLKVAEAITSPREKIHALSRIVRLLQAPDSRALPRYL